MASDNVVEYVLKINANKGKVSLKQLAGDAKKSQRELDKTGSKGKIAMAKLALSAKKARAAITGLVGSLSAVGVAAGLAGVGIFALVKKQADYVNQLNDTATRTGIAIDSLAGLKLAAEGSGKSFESVERGLDQFIPKLSMAANETSRAGQFFSALGVSVNDSNGKLRDSNSVFNETLSQLGRIEDQTTQNAFAFEIFGRQAGGALIQSGALDNLDQFIDKAKQIGPALDEGAIKKAAEFQVGWAELKTSVVAVVGDLIQSLMGEESLGKAMSRLADNARNLGSGIGLFFDDVKDAYAGLKIFLDDINSTILGIVDASPVGAYFRAGTTFAKDFETSLMVKRGEAPDVKGDEDYAVGEVEQPSYRDMHDRTMKMNAEYARNVAKYIAKNYESMTEFSQAVKDNAVDATEAFEDIKSLLESGTIEPGYIKTTVPELQASFEKAKKEQAAVTKKAKEMQDKASKKRSRERGSRPFVPMIPTDKTKNDTDEVKKNTDAQKELFDIFKHLSDIIPDLNNEYKSLNNEIDITSSEITKAMQDGNFNTDKMLEKVGDLNLNVDELKDQWILLGYDGTEAVQPLINKLFELGKQAEEAAIKTKKLSDIKLGINISANILDIAGGDLVGGVSNLFGQLAERGTVSQGTSDIVGGVGSIVTSLEQLGSQLAKAEDEALDKYINELVLAQEKASGKKLSDEEIKAIENGLSSSEVERIKEQGRKDMVRARLENMASFISLAITELPIILLEVLPPMLTKLGANIIQAIFQLPGRLISGIVNGFIEAMKMLGQIIGDFFGGAASAVFEDTKSALGGMVENVGNFFGGLFGGGKRQGGRFISARSGIRFTGMRDQMAQLHRNEFVVSESGAMPQGVKRIMNERGGGGGGGVVINIHADVVERNAIDSLIRKIERQYQNFGTSTSTLFGETA